MTTEPVKDEWNLLTGSYEDLNGSKCGGSSLVNRVIGLINQPGPR